MDWRGNWEGVQCRGQSSLPDHVPRVVTNFHLPDRGLPGPLPPTLILLRNLTEIDQDNNQHTGVRMGWSVVPVYVSLCMPPMANVLRIHVAFIARR